MNIRSFLISRMVFTFLEGVFAYFSHFSREFWDDQGEIRQMWDRIPELPGIMVALTKGGGCVCYRYVPYTPLSFLQAHQVRTFESTENRVLE